RLGLADGRRGTGGEDNLPRPGGAGVRAKGPEEARVDFAVAVEVLNGRGNEQVGRIVRVDGDRFLVLVAGELADVDVAAVADPQRHVDPGRVNVELRQRPVRVVEGAVGVIGPDAVEGARDKRRAIVVPQAERPRGHAVLRVQ